MSKAVVIEEEHNYKLKWDLDIDTNDTSTVLRLPLATRFGTVELEVKIAAPQDLELVWKSDGCEDVGHPDEVSAALFWISGGGDPGLMTKTAWKRPTFPSIEDLVFPEFDFDDIRDRGYLGSMFGGPYQRRFRVELLITKARPPLALQYPPFTPSTMVDMQIGATVKRPNNVRLYFPRIEAELWTSASLLAMASPYFVTLFKSSFAENIPRRGGKRARISGVAAAGVVAVAGRQKVGAGAVAEASHSDAGRDSDSDEETDQVVKKLRPPALEDDDDNDNNAFREIEITETAYSTYRAVLLYLHSGHITFATLASTFTLPNTPSRASYIEVEIAELPNRPPPVSPKSAYRLAHLLEIAPLKALSLAALEEKLEEDIAAQELFSETSLLYPEVQAVILKYVVAHWQEVKKSGGLAAVEKRVDAGELPQAGGVLLKLMRLVSK